VFVLAKIKIYELAKELAVESKDILRKLQKMSVLAKNHMSSISDKDADAIRQQYAQKAAGNGAIAMPGGFVPRVKRIPKSVLEKELAGQATAEALDIQPEQAKPEEKAPDVAKIAAEAAAITAVKETAVKEAPPPTPAPAAEKPEMPAPEQPALKAKINAAEKTVVPEKITVPEESKNIEVKNIPEKAGIPEKTSAAEKTTGAEKPARPQGQGRETPRAKGQGGSSDKPRPQGQGGYGDKPRQQGQGGYSDRPRPQGQGGYSDRPRPQGQGGYSDRPRPQGQGGYSDRPRPQGQGGYSDKPRPQGQGQDQSRAKGQGGYGDRPRPQGQGQSQGQGRPKGQGGYGDRPRPQGQGQGQGQGQNRPKGQGGYSDKQRQQGSGQGRASGARGGLNIPPPAVAQEKPSNYRPPASKKNFTKDQIFERTSTEDGGRSRDYRANKGRKDKFTKKGRKEAKMVMPPVVPKKITISETVVLSELAKAMSKTAAEIIKKLLEMGIMATINQEMDAETAILLADEFGITVEIAVDKAAEIMVDIEDEAAEMIERPPVVTIMGHVDHGKTSLLDAIRHTNVISTEAGGITQHIGAYQVEIKGKKITFLDTPGHEAFTAMRARGAQVTDIAIIVVAADDGVMPQTIEAINHSKAAGVPIIIAINKIDKPDANPDRVKQELTGHELVSEEWGGETIMVPVSAKSRQNIEGLLEMILLVAEVAELRANPNRQARGTVVESRLDKARGPVVTLLVQKGTLQVGDSLLAGPVFGKVRAMTDDKGRKVRAALPSMPVEVMGFSEVPTAGEIFIAAKDDKDARFVAHRQQIKKREEELRKTAHVSLDDLFKRIAEGEIKELNLVVKADVHGSVEAIQQSLPKLNTEEVKVKVIHAGVGGVSESDVMLATASNAIIIGFNVRPMPAALKAAERENVDIRLYRVIYDALEDIKKAMSGLLSPEYKEQVIGHAEVRAVFKVPKAGMVAGSYVQEGKITRNAQARVVRDSVVIAEDKIDSLRRFKDDVKEVLTGFECGIGLENFNDIKEGDIIEAFVMEEIKREL